jgi:hypothetical protein
MPEKKTYRAKLTVKKVLEPVKAREGPAEVLPFLDHEGKRYGVWDSAFKPYITEGAQLDADVSESTRAGQDGQQFVNRNITQLYIEGQPVKLRVRGGGGASPQQIASEEARAAVSEILNCGKELMSPEQQTRLKQLVDKALDRCEAWLAASPAAAVSPAPASTLASKPRGKATAQPPPATAEEHWDQLGKERDETTQEKPNFENRGQLFSKAYKELELSQSEALVILEVTRPTDIEDLGAAWLKLVAAIKPVRNR